jgi:hypothetical protein
MPGDPDFQTGDPQQDVLLGRRIRIRLPDGNTIDTGSIFGEQGGKHRIRLAADQAGGRDLYPHWHVAGALLLPRPARDEDAWMPGQPIMRNREYGIMHLRLGAVDVTQPGLAVVTVRLVEVRNQSGQHEFAFADRYAEVVRLWDHAARYEDDVRDLLAEHRQLMQGGGMVSHDALRITDDLQQRMAETAADYDVVPAAPNTDPLPTLESIIQIDPPEANINPTAIPQEDIVLRRRTIAQQRRWAAARGGSAVRFRRQVQRAWRFTCAVCGLRLPPVGSGGCPGVDSAHILPYAEYDLDHARNGICLCKLHHWAFDEGLILVRWNGTAYEVIVPAASAERMQDAGVQIDEAVLRGSGTIPSPRLPASAAERPSPEALAALETLLFG